MKTEKQAKAELQAFEQSLLMLDLSDKAEVARAKARHAKLKAALKAAKGK